jgi:hypothetical protein
MFKTTPEQAEKEQSVAVTWQACKAFSPGAERGGDWDRMYDEERTGNRQQRGKRGAWPNEIPSCEQSVDSDVRNNSPADF